MPKEDKEKSPKKEAAQETEAPIESTVDEVEVEETADTVVEETPTPEVSPEAEPEVAVEPVTSEPIFEQIDNSAQTTDNNEIATGEQPVTVQPVAFASFEDLSQTQGETNKNLDILMDIKLQLTVELGRTELPIKKVLELTRGSIIELEKVAGEPVELYANGKLIAHGEVVVIEDNFGLRITSITDPEERLKES